MDFEQEVAPRLIAAGHKIRDEFTERFLALKAAGSKEAFSPLLGFGSREQDLGPAGYDPKAPIKFAYQVKGAVVTVRRYLPYFAGVKRGFEIGVGAGYLMRSLIDVHGIAMRGCDIDIKRLGVYRAIRAELGLTDLVTEQRIEPRRPVVLPPDTEAVVGFLPAWTAKWDLEDYQWFHTDLKRQRVRRMFWQMNANIDKPEIRAYFDSIGETPVSEDNRRFVIVDL